MTPQNHVSLDEFHFIAKQLRPMVNEDFLLQLEVSIVPANHKSDAILPFIDLDFKRHFSVAIPFKLQPQKSPVSAVEAGLFWLGGRMR